MDIESNDESARFHPQPATSESSRVENHTTPSSSSSNNNINNSSNADDDDEGTGLMASTVNRPLEEWDRLVYKAQSVSLVLAHATSIPVLIALGMWIHTLGGLKSTTARKNAFNWHPVFMILAFLFMTMSSLCFRYRVLPKHVAKFCHGVAWTVALICMIAGLIAVFRSHNVKGAYIANLYSLHSWVGITVLFLYSIQFGAGLYAFSGWIRGVPASAKAKILQLHRFVGPTIYVAMLATIMLGIQEKEGFIGCSYPVQDDKGPDSMIPFLNWNKIPRVCKISHTMAFLVLIMGACTLFSLHQFDRGNNRR